jgi:hypothetical protein
VGKAYDQATDTYTLVDAATNELTTVFGGEWREAMTCPDNVSGLSPDRRSSIMGTVEDGMAFGQLYWELEAKAQWIYVRHNPVYFRDVFHNLDQQRQDWLSNNWTHRFVVGQKYRIKVVEEYMLVECVAVQSGKMKVFFPLKRTEGGWSSTSKDVTTPADDWIAHLQILERPSMANWQQSAPSRRTDMGEEAAWRWFFYGSENPIYYATRPDPRNFDRPALQGEWVTEVRQNCGHHNYVDDPNYPHLKWDAEANACVLMSPEEQAAYDAYLADRLAVVEETRVESRAAVQASAMATFGMSREEEESWANPPEGPNRPSIEEAAARRAGMQARGMVLSYVTDLNQILVEAVAVSMIMWMNDNHFPPGDETSTARRSRGELAYRAMGTLTRRELQRDYTSMRMEMTVNFAKAIGGPYGFAAIWVSPAQPQIGTPRSAPRAAPTNVVSKPVLKQAPRRLK